MKHPKAKNNWRTWEVEKAHGDIPDGLGIGVHEMRTGDGELVIYFQGNNTTPRAPYVVLGKFAQPRDGKWFYVFDHRAPFVIVKHATSYHEDLLMAVSWIMELKQEWETRNANLHN